jgi:transforming growth factor-beta-induced protein
MNQTIFIVFRLKFQTLNKLTMKMNLCFIKKSTKFFSTVLGLLVMNVTIAQTNVFDNIISTSPNHTYLTAAITQQNLQGALQDPTATLTVFAPTDAAFEALAVALDTDIAGLLALPNLTDILLYHVLGVTVVSGDLSNGITPQPLNAANTIKMTVTSGGNVFANQAQVTTADLTASNGVVHVTNGVLLPNLTVVDLAINNNFTILTTAVIQQELVPALSNPFGTFTVFAPTDAAFANLLDALDITAAELLEFENLTDILLYHVLGVEVPSSAVTNGLLATPLNDENTIKMTVTSGGDVFANHAQVVLADVNADNGVVHAIDAVILPVITVVDIAINNDFNYLVAAVIQEGLVPALSNPLAAFTVFAPTDQAFEDLATALETDIAGLLGLETLSTVLLYHVVAGEVASTDLENGTVNTLADITINVNVDAGVLINTSTVILADVLAFNGIVHVIDRVLVPGGSPVSVPNFDNVTITAYPNPASTSVSFAGLNEADLNIVDINGSVVFTGKYNGTAINISDLSSGMYFIYVTNEQNTSVVRLSVK